MNYKLLSLVASCVLVILNAVPIRGVATPQLPLEVHGFAAILVLGFAGSLVIYSRRGDRRTKLERSAGGRGGRYVVSFLSPSIRISKAPDDLERPCSTLRRDPGGGRCPSTRR